MSNDRAHLAKYDRAEAARASSNPLLRYGLGPALRWAAPLRKANQHRKIRRDLPTVEDGLRAFEQRCDPVEPLGDEPVMLFSAGWRSGSTLLQRMFLAAGDKRLLLWGEPFHRTSTVQSLTESLRAFGTGWPMPEAFLEGVGPDDYWKHWTGNLYPSPTDLARAHQRFLEALLRTPAHDRGFARWGIKEVRFGYDESRHLRFLFPDARFVFLHRNPLDAWASYRAMPALQMRWPNQPVLGPRAFGCMWSDLVRGAARFCDEFDGLIVSYEDVVSDAETRRAIGDHVRLEPDESVLTHRVGDSTRLPVPRWERLAIRSAARSAARSVGYDL